MERQTAQTLDTLRENLRRAREVRQAAQERGNLDLVAAEDEAIARLEQRIAQIEATAARLQDRADVDLADPAAP